MADQQVSIGVKISDDLIKQTLALHIARTIGDPGDLLAKVVCSVLDKKKDTYSSTPTFLEELVQSSIKPIATEEWNKYLQTIEPDLRKIIQTKLRRKVDKERLLNQVNIALDNAFAKFMGIEFQTRDY